MSEVVVLYKLYRDGHVERKRIERAELEFEPGPEPDLARAWVLTEGQFEAQWQRQYDVRGKTRQ